MTPDARLMIGLFLIAAGVVTALLGLLGLAELRRSRNWPAVTGEVLSATVRRRFTTPASGPPASHLSRAEVLYRYRVGEQDYHGHIIELGGRFRQTPAMAARQAVSYRPGEPVTVYHDPNNPGRACLVRGGGGIGGRLAAAVALIIAGAVLSAGG